MSARCSSVETLSPCSGSERDTCAGAHGEHDSVDVHGLAHGRFQVPNDADGLLRADDVSDDDGELIAAEAGDGGAPMSRLDEAFRHLAQEPVARSVAERVVHLFEAIEVEQGDRCPTRLGEGG